MMLDQKEVVITGAGIYGLYAALEFGKKGTQVFVIECEDAAFKRASYINQARIHNGYHYPRSISTASKSADYFNRFNKDFGYAANSEFRKVYALSSNFSYTNGEQFKKFCDYTGIPAKRIDPSEYFQEGKVDAAFETVEYAFDAFLIRDRMLKELASMPNVQFLFNTRITKAEISGRDYVLSLSSGDRITTGFVLNATYASVNQVLDLFGFDQFKIKYEICEIALCKPNKALDGLGLTVMDGPFFSVMPFGCEGIYSLTSVTFTPHVTSYDKLPVFGCQKVNQECTPKHLQDCNVCPARPKPAWDYMYQLSRNYLKPHLDMQHVESLFAIKPILMASELDDSRPTVIRECRTNPRFVTVLSGKINTLYDLDEILI